MKKATDNADLYQSLISKDPKYLTKREASQLLQHARSLSNLVGGAERRGRHAVAERARRRIRNIMHSLTEYAGRKHGLNLERDPYYRGVLAIASRTLTFPTRPNARKHARYTVQARKGTSGRFTTVASDRNRDKAVVKAVKHAKVQPVLQWRVRDERNLKTLWQYKGGKVQVPAWRQKTPKGLIGFQHLLNPVRHNLDTREERERLEADVSALKGRFRALVSSGRLDAAREIVGWFKGVADAAIASGSPAAYVKRMRSVARVLDSRIPEHPKKRGGEPPQFLFNRPPNEAWTRATRAQRAQILRAAGVPENAVQLYVRDSWPRLDATLKAMIRSKWEGTTRRRKASANPKRHKRASKRRRPKRKGRRSARANPWRGRTPPRYIREAVCGRACPNPSHKHNPLRGLMNKRELKKAGRLAK